MNLCSVCVYVHICIAVGSIPGAGKEGSRELVAARCAGGGQAVALHHILRRVLGRHKVVIFTSDLRTHQLRESGKTCSQPWRSQRGLPQQRLDGVSNHTYAHEDCTIVKETAVNVGLAGRAVVHNNAVALAIRTDGLGAST